MKGLFL